MSFDADVECVLFQHLPRAVQRRAVFLDPRYVASAPASPKLDIAGAPIAEIRAARGPVHFIFHTAFCCSTLLTRALDIPGVSMGLKEPAILMDMSRALTPARRSHERLATLAIVLDLLSRRLADGEAQIVKASNAANDIIPLILDARPDAKAVLMFSSLDAFLHAVARKGFHGRSFGRSLYAHLGATIPLPAHYSITHLFALTDMQIAAQVWLMQALEFSRVARRYGHDRVRLLDCNALLADPAATLRRVACFFDLEIEPQQVEQVVEGRVFREHAKQPGVAFDRHQHRAQSESASLAHYEELSFVLTWARQLARHCGIPAALHDTLSDTEEARDVVPALADPQRRLPSAT
jgi:hypothetical protein